MLNIAFFPASKIKWALTQLRPWTGTTLLALATVVLLVIPPEAVSASAAGRASQGPGVIRSVRSGTWSAPATWERGKVPDGGSRVQVRAGHTVTYDLQSDQVIRSIHVAGTLRF